MEIYELPPRRVAWLDRWVRHVDDLLNATVWLRGWWRLCLVALSGVDGSSSEGRPVVNVGEPFEGFRYFTWHSPKNHAPCLRNRELDKSSLQVQSARGKGKITEIQHRLRIHCDARQFSAPLEGQGWPYSKPKHYLAITWPLHWPKTESRRKRS
jgi:hypothetical protein